MRLALFAEASPPWRNAGWPVNFLPVDHIRDIERPDDFETLEYGKDLVVKLESFPVCLATEIAAMGSQPPLSRAVPSPSSQANASST
jgi:hypothetical protein